jgi:hypothetical protein
MEGNTARLQREFSALNNGVPWTGSLWKEFPLLAGVSRP